MGRFEQLRPIRDRASSATAAGGKVGRWLATRHWWLRHREVGRFARVTGGSVVVEGSGRISLGPRCRLMAEHGPILLRSGEGATISLGARTAVNYGAVIEAVTGVAIGDDVSIGPYSVISDRSADSGAPISIGDGAWLATRVVVAPGSTIGPGSVIAAGSLVEGEIPAGVLASGIPARVIRRLDDGVPEHDAAPAGSRTAGAEGESEPDEPRRPIGDAPIAAATLISDFTIDPLADALAAGADPIAADVAPFGAIGPSLLSPPDGSGRDLAIVWTLAEQVLPSLARLRDGETVGDDEIERDVRAHVELLYAGAVHYDVVIAPTWTRPPTDTGRPPSDGRRGGLGYGYDLANHLLRRAIADLDRVVALDAARWIELAGPRGLSGRGWYEGKLPFLPAVFGRAADDIARVARARRVTPRKVLVVDLDNTLWGGVVGDDGIEGIVLGGHDAAGEAFVDFQRAVRSLARRGIVLAIASKNDEETALRAIDDHPEMVLRRADFVTWRIDWLDKAQNIADMAIELNLGLDSFVFVDDNPRERDRVREALPGVLVPDWPVDPIDYGRALSELTCFDSLEVTTEDTQRTRMYRDEAERQRSRRLTSSVDDWIRGLEIEVVARPLSRAELQRAAQLLNKTNQMNLRTRRLSDGELWDWAQGSTRETWCVTVADRLGDSGLTGLLSVEIEGSTAHLVDYVMSCRVMGRRVEEAMVTVAARIADRRGAETLLAELVPTEKNAPCVRFFDGVDPDVVDTAHRLPVAQFLDAPDAIDLQMPVPAPTGAG